MGRYSKAFSIKKQFQSPNCQTCQGQSRTLKKIVFLELLLRITEEEKWNLFEKLGQLRTPSQWLPRMLHITISSSDLHLLTMDQMPTSVTSQHQARVREPRLGQVRATAITPASSRLEHSDWSRWSREPRRPSPKAVTKSKACSSDPRLSLSHSKHH